MSKPVSVQIRVKQNVLIIQGTNYAESTVLMYFDEALKIKFIT